MKAAAPIVAAALVWGLLGGEAHRKTERGNRAYESGDLQGAMGAYADAQGAAPEAPELHYDVGNVFFRQKDWAKAEDAYGRALAGGRGDLAAHAAYNLGNARFRDGRFDEAAEAYRRALRAAPGDADAKRNLELALRAIDQKKKPEGQPEPQPGSDEDKKKDDEKKRDESEKKDDPRGSPKPEPAPGTLTPEQARRLLERLSDQEKENVKREAMRRAQVAPSRAPEKDW